MEVREMADLNEVVAPIEEQATDVVTTVPTVEPVADNTAILDNATSEHPVLFFIIMGAVCVAGIGIPLLIWYVLKLRKKLKQYEDRDKQAQAPATEGTEKASDPAPQKEAETKDAKTDKK